MQRCANLIHHGAANAFNHLHAHNITNQHQFNPRMSPTYAPPHPSPPPGQFFSSGPQSFHPNLTPPSFQFPCGPPIYLTFQLAHAFGLTPGPYQPTMMPIYVAREPPKFKLPKDWDGSTSKWPLFKHKMEMVCQELNMTFLTRTTEMTPQMEEQSKKFTKALHAIIPHTAMADF